MRFLSVMCLVALWCVPALAQGVQYKSNDKAGFGDVSRALDGMSPKQREQLRKQGALKQKELHAYTPAEMDELRLKLRQIRADTPKASAR